MQWYLDAEKRSLPWKNSQNAYHIWLSEIILQQTRVAQGKPYYEKFVRTFPTITELADATEDEVLKLWQGLGYYSRARNLHHTAKFIKEHYKGIFPNTYEDIRALKGVGDYTAAAIASFAFDLPYSVLDGNVYRVLARFFGIDTPIDSTEGKKQFAQLAQELLAVQQAADYNQAIMDLGALICKPQTPLCTQCHLKEACVAFQDKKVSAFPVKSKKLEKKQRFFYYIVWKSPEGCSVLQKRGEKDIWEGLYDFPLLELDSLLEVDRFSFLWETDIWMKWMQDKPFSPTISRISGPHKQMLTHQTIVAFFIEIEAAIPLFFNKNLSYMVVEQKNIEKFAVPKIVQQYLTQRQSSLF